MSIELVPLCTIHIVLREQILVGNGPSGFRVVAELDSATITGDRLSGHLKGTASGDWVTVNGTIGVIDVRTTYETDDGAVVFCSYRGRMDLTNGPGSAPIYVAPLFETGDPRYGWLNLVQAVAKGDLRGNDLTYEVFEVR